MKNKGMKRLAEEAHGPLEGGGVLHGDHGVGDFDARSSRRNFAASCQVKESNLNKMSFIVE